MNAQGIESNPEGNGLADALPQMTNFLEGDVIIKDPPPTNPFSRLSNVHKIATGRGRRLPFYSRRVSELY